MCGLVGMLTTGKTSDAEIKLFKGLLLIDQLRGEHATGVFKVDLAKNEVSTIKRAMNATDFLAQEDVKKFLDEDRVNLYVGHNRYATMGDKGKHENAHPFQHEHITMVHNGGVDAWGLDMLEGYNDKEVEVDSHMVCMTLAKHGVKEAVTNKLAGAFALIWWDQKERSLNFIRNQERPLWFAVTTAGAIVWASEKAFLDVFLERAGKASGYRVKPILMDKNEHHKFLFTEQGYKKGTGPVVEEMEFLEISYPKYSGAANKGWWESNVGKASTSTISQRSNGASTEGLAEAVRINKTLTDGGSSFRYGSVVSAQIIAREPYPANPQYGSLTLQCLNTGTKLKAWGIKLNDLLGYEIVRANISNAYKSIVNGVEGLTISVEKVGVSIHDPKYNARTTPAQVSTSHGDLESARRVQAKIDEMEIEKQKREEAERNRNQKPRLRLAQQQIHYPLKVQGHTFQSAAEFREFVSQGCSSCGEIPEAYNPKNTSLTVYTGEKFTGLLDECEFICGRCVEV